MPRVGLGMALQWERSQVSRYNESGSSILEYGPTDHILEALVEEDQGR